jgi:hypothetical protein
MPDFVQNDTGSLLSLTLQDQSGVAIDLTGSAVTLQYYIDSNPPLYTKNMSITDPKNGKCQYLFTSAVVNGVTVYDLISPGVLHFTVVITFPGGAVVTTPFEGQITVHPAWPLQN